jgi:thioredoxin 2
MHASCPTRDVQGAVADVKMDRTGVIVSCGACGRANRLAFEALAKTTRCGQCRAPLGAPAVPIEIDDPAAFEAAAARSALPLLVDFWAPWCGPCKMVAPELERVARANAGRYLVVKVDTDTHQDIGARFRIRSIPTLAFVSAGREIDRLAGARPAQEIEAFAARAMASAARHAS